MKSCVMILLLALLAAPPAGAVADPQPDGFGVYFDPDADNSEYYTSANVPFFVYYVLTNPTAVEWSGMEFRYQLLVPAGFESLMFKLLHDLPPGMICVSCEEDWTALEGNVRLAGFGPYPTGAATVLLQFQYIMLAEFFVDFYVGATPFTGPDSGQLAYQSGAAWIPMTPRSGSPDFPVAQINPLRVAEQQQSFGSVKAVYR